MKTVGSGRRNGEGGFVAVVMLAMVILILAFLAGNDVTLRSLKREIQLIERHQLAKYPPGHATNRVGPVAVPTQPPAAHDP
jgi:hypothetical protein